MPNEEGKGVLLYSVRRLCSAMQGGCMGNERYRWKTAIPAGEFEEIRPPYRGKCWVKKNGKWGVIELQEKDSSEEGA